MNYLSRQLLHQLTAALQTLSHCIDRCPVHLFNESQGDHPFSQVVFHALFYADYYLGTDAVSFKDQPFHVAHSMEFADYEELEDVEPVHLYEQSFCQAYLEHVKRKANDTLQAESLAVLRGPSGISFRHMARAELHVYNTRHIQHHAAQLGLRLQFALGEEMPWISGEQS